MVPRYSRPEMVAIWSQQNKYRLWFDIEAHALTAMANLGVVPKDVPKRIWDRAQDLTFDTDRIDAIEQETKHDVIAFLTYLSLHLGEESRFIHQGLTSSDILDTAFSLQLSQACRLIDQALIRLLKALKRQAHTHKSTVMIGRSHGIFAEPTTFGLKLAGAFAEFARHRVRLEHARREIAICAISGAVGTYAHVHPQVEAYVAQQLDLTPETISTQVIPRDRHAMLFAVFGVIASSIERLATELRHLQRSEVQETEEYFSQGQKGSSAMPHKRNPILSENLCGLARIVRSYVVPSMEDVALWHERDISHSSVERYIAPDATITLDFALHRAAQVIESLIVYPEAMRKHLEQARGIYESQRVLLALTQKGLSREEAYALVQANAMSAWNNNMSFKEVLLSDPKITEQLDKKAIENCFNLDYHLTFVEHIFKNVFEGSDIN